VDYELRENHRKQMTYGQQFWLLEFHFGNEKPGGYGRALLSSSLILTE
jgi:hypothetical protein